MEINGIFFTGYKSLNFLFFFFLYTNVNLLNQKKITAEEKFAGDILKTEKYLTV